MTADDNLDSWLGQVLDDDAEERARVQRRQERNKRQGMLALKDLERQDSAIVPFLPPPSVYFADVPVPTTP